MKKTMIVLLVAVFSAAVLATPAAAGEKQRHRWEGVAIGAAAVLLGHAIVHSYQDHAAAESVSVNRYHKYRSGCYSKHDRGHWTIRKTWVPPVCEKVWNPGHYNRFDEYVPGRWIIIEKEGYWKKERVWVGSP